MSGRKVTILMIGIICLSFAQYKWERIFGGSERDQVFSVALSPDGGYIAAGFTMSYPQKCYEMYIVKTNAQGDSVWAHNYGTAFNDYCWSISPTHDSGYVLLGATDSIFQTGPHDVYLVRIDKNGDSLWARVYGDTSSGPNTNDVGRKIQPTADGGYIIIGSTESYGAGFYDIYFVKIDAAGDTQWTRTYGTSYAEYGKAVHQAADGGYIAAGQKYESGFGNQIWILKMDENGDTTWTRTYGGSGSEDVNDVEQTTDLGYVFVGNTTSFGAGNGDLYIVKIDSSGYVDWEKTYGNSYPDWGNALALTGDGGMIIAGGTRTSPDPEDCYAWLLRVNQNGDTVWSRLKAPDPGSANGMDVQLALDGGFILAAICWEYGGDDNFYLVKTDTGGLTVFEDPFNQDKLNPLRTPSVYPNPFSFYAVVSGHEDQLYNVYNSAGQLVGTYPGMKIGYDLSAGVYFLSPQNQDHDSIRIVKVR